MGNRRMRISCGLDVFVVVPMRERPPQRSSLSALRSDEPQHELRDAANTIGPVGEIAVVNRIGGQDANAIADEAQYREIEREGKQQNRQQRTDVALDDTKYHEPLGLWSLDAEKRAWRSPHLIVVSVVALVFEATRAFYRLRPAGILP